MAQEENRLVHFACACGQTGGSVQVPTSAFPLRLTLCHCNACQHQSGMLAAFFVGLPRNIESFTTYGAPVSYKVSDALTRYFCSTCGTNIFIDVKMAGYMVLCSGAITDEGVETELQGQIYVKDTKDGGMSSWLPSIQGWEEYGLQSKPVDPEHPLVKPSEIDEKRTALELPAYCQCRKVEFKITRPNEKSSDLHGPFADLFVPYVSSAPETIANKDDIKWWLSRQGPKYLAGTCACHSCRKNSGYDIQAWAFIPKVNLIHTDGSLLEVEKWQSLTEYKSSLGVHRYFCDTCGATVFWCCDSRPDLIDVSAGLLDAEEGTRAESWLQWWTNRISFEEEAPNKSLIASLKSGLKSWGEQSGDSGQNAPANWT